MLQDQDIKGFTLLELLAVLAIVLIVTAVGLPNFNSWKTEREVRVGAEKIAQVLSGVNAQTKRGTFPYVQMHINANVSISGVTGNYPGTIVLGRGMTRTNLSKKLNSGKFPDCDTNLRTVAGSWEAEPTYEYKLKNIYLHVKNINAICYSADETYYATTDEINQNKNITLDQGSTDQYIIVCSATEKNARTAGKCPVSKTAGLKRPAYLIEWSRFGNVKRHKWSGSDWIR